jgi:hypothetical protein
MALVDAIAIVVMTNQSCSHHNLTPETTTARVPFSLDFNVSKSEFESEILAPVVLLIGCGHEVRHGS